MVLLALVGLAACSGARTGVTQLPIPPSRDVVAFTTAPPANGPPDAPVNDCKKGGSGAYRLGAGDRVRVIVPADPDISSDYEVNSSGAITARRLGAVPVVGLSVSDLKSRLLQRYRDARYFTPSSVLSVELVSTRPFYIVGEVGRQGSFPYVSCLRVIQAIALAGGIQPPGLQGQHNDQAFLRGIVGRGICDGRHAGRTRRCPSCPGEVVLAGS